MKQTIALISNYCVGFTLVTMLGTIGWVFAVPFVFVNSYFMLRPEND